MADQVSLTYVNEIGPDSVTYLAQRPETDSHAAIELLDNSGQAMGRLLTRLVGAEPAIRGFYVVTAKILDRIPTQLSGVIFNRAYFE